ncbi:hypothetical protein DENSPDRAFT_852859 [Dentipellis sp. KUC8613]|nr:hypothetical protein DENSPDRAFT_852859 [Dentipellis sp. KUC8613]
MYRGQLKATVMSHEKLPSSEHCGVPQLTVPRPSIYTWVLFTKEDTMLMTLRTPNMPTCKSHLCFPTRDALTTTHCLLTLENPALMASPFSSGVEIHVLDLPEVSFDSRKAA